MFPLLETIRLENGILQNLDNHERRLNNSLEQLFGNRNLPPIDKIIHIPENLKSGIFKVRLIYSDEDYNIDITPYKKRKINNLITIEKPDIKYDLKYADRSVFKKISETINPDDEVIISINGFLTDTTYTNIAFEKDGQWISPEKPLLEGTQRAYLLSKGIIKKGHIRINDIRDFNRVRLFNAMIPWEESIELTVDKIRIND